LRIEASDLRARNSALESELGMTRGAQEALTKQASELAAENTQIKEELAFLQKLVSDSSKTVGLQIQQIAIEPDGEDMWRYPAADRPRRQSRRRNSTAMWSSRPRCLHHPTAPARPGRSSCRRTSRRPRRHSSSNSSIISGFEGRLRVPPGGRITAVTVRCFEAGQGSNPRATRTLSLS
jgi:hypothetical protein